MSCEKMLMSIEKVQTQPLQHEKCNLNFTGNLQNHHFFQGIHKYPYVDAILQMSIVILPDKHNMFSQKCFIYP